MSRFAWHLLIGVVLALHPLRLPASNPSRPDGIDYSGKTDSRLALVELLNLHAGHPVHLSPGVIRIDAERVAANTIVIPPHTKLIGKDTTIFCTNPGIAQVFFRLSDDVHLEQLHFAWDPLTPPTDGAGAILLGIRAQLISLRHVSLSGAGEHQATFLANHANLALWQCRQCTLDEMEIRWSVGGAFGLELLGCRDIRVRNSHIHHNSADGVKIHGDGVYGMPSQCRFEHCRFDENGQAVIQGQTWGPIVQACPVPEHGQRYRLGFTKQDRIIFPPSTTVAPGTSFILSRLIGSPRVVLAPTPGETWNGTVQGETPFENDHVLMRATAVDGGWHVVPWCNGQGVDMMGLDHEFSHCSARGNEGGGFQIKTVDISSPFDPDRTYDQFQLAHYQQTLFRSLHAQNRGNVPPEHPTSWEPHALTTQGIRFRQCAAMDSWGANGFAIVNEGFGRIPPPHDIEYVECAARGNYHSGFAFTTAEIADVRLERCESRSNFGSGMSIQSGCHDFELHACEFLGNGKRNSSDWNVMLMAASHIHLLECKLCGVDPAEPDLHAQGTTYRPRCYGLYLLQDSPGFQMRDVTLKGLRTSGHRDNVDLGFYTSHGHTTAAECSRPDGAGGLVVGRP